MQRIERARLSVGWVVIAALASACTNSSLRYTFRDPGQVSPPGVRTMVVYPGRTTPRRPDGNAQMTLVTAHHEFVDLGPVTYRDANGNVHLDSEGHVVTVPGVYDEITHRTVVTDWDNVTIEEIKTPNRYLGVMSLVIAVCILPFFMIDGVEANGPLGYTVVGFTAGGLWLTLWPASTTTSWAPPR